jgi:1,2-diacylglycerol 3-alpha-glucosyltransferase
MKITHICLGCFYIEGMEYQENVLPRIHRRLGLETSVIFSGSSDDVMVKTTSKERIQTYVNRDDVQVFKLLTCSKFHKRYCRGLTSLLRQICPDIIFVHGGQFMNLHEVVRYKRLNPNVKIYLDQHADFYNTPIRYWPLKKLITSCINKYFYGYWIRKTSRCAEKVWGVTPWRVQYLQEVYKVPKEKTDLLVMGGDDDKIHWDRQQEIRREIRQKHDVKEEDFLIIAGGKIDRTKNFHLILEAMKKLERPSVKVILFGKPNEEMAPILEKFAAGDSRIRLIGWLDSARVYDYFLSADLAVFPGTHSVLWEQACACGLPALFKSWPGMKHVDVGGNCRFLTQDSADEIRAVLDLMLTDNAEIWKQMKKVALEKAVAEFSYNNIARKAIGLPTT